MVADREGCAHHTSRTGEGHIYLISTAVAILGLLMGYHLGIISGGILFLKGVFGLSPSGVGFAVSSVAIGCLIGPILGGTVAEKLGRKRTLAYTALLFAAAGLGTALPRNIIEFNLFRVLGGVGVGMASVVAPMYLAEISPARIRGRLVTLNQLAIVTGGLCSIIISYLLSLSGNWRWMFGAQVIPALFLLAGLAYVPESPRWLVQENRLQEALHVLTRIGDRESAETELKVISSLSSSTEESCHFSELFRPGTRAALEVAIVLGVLQQTTGASTLFLYAPIIFQKAGFATTHAALAQAIFLNAWALICTIVALWLVDRAGRRPLLLIGTLGMLIGFALMGTFFHFVLSGWPVLLIMFLCVGSYAISLGPLAWLIMSETFPAHVREKGMGVGSLSVWFSLFVTNQVFPPLVAHMERRFGTAAGVFWMFAVVCAAAFIFVLRFVPETKGRSLEEIGKSWIRN